MLAQFTQLWIITFQTRFNFAVNGAKFECLGVSIPFIRIRMVNFKCHVSIFRLNIPSDGVLLQSTNGKPIDNFPCNIRMVVARRTCFWIVAIAVKRVASVEELTDISSDIIVYKKLSTWMRVSKRGNVNN